MNLYNRNTVILKDFFKKPLTIIISILFFAAAVIPCIYLIVKMTASGIFDSFVFCVYSMLAILPSVAFLNLFIKGRKNKEIKHLNAPLIIMYIYSILSVLLPAAFFTYVLLSCALDEDEFSFLIVSTVLVLFIIPALILLILQFISTIITFHSIRKSANGIYLSGKGAVFMGVTSLLVATAVTTVTPIFFVDATSSLRTLNYADILGIAIITLELAVLIALFVCLGIWAPMYSSTIKKAAVHLYGAGKKSAVKVQTLADVQNVQHSEIKNNFVQSTQDFVSQQTFVNKETPIIAKTNYEKPDVFSLPKQNEPNPYESGKSYHKKPKQEETPNHINFQNPYENFVPQNPFSNE